MREEERQRFVKRKRKVGKGKEEDGDQLNVERKENGGRDEGWKTCSKTLRDVKNHRMKIKQQGREKKQQLCCTSYFLESSAALFNKSTYESSLI